MNTIKSFYLLLAVGLPELLIAQSEDTTDRLLACARIEIQSARAACYEALGRDVLSAESNESVAPGVEPAKTEPPVPVVKDAPVAATATSAPTNVPFKGEERAVEEYRVAVQSCEENKNREMYFVLDNGEIWKQTGGKRVKESDCIFNASLRKDVFGYKMTADGDKGSIRVKRVQ